MTQFAITGRVAGVNRPNANLTVSFAPLGVDPADVSLEADEPTDDCVQVRLRIGPAQQWGTIAAAEVSLGASDARERITAYAAVGRTPVLTATAGLGTNEFVFDVLPGYVNPAPNSRQLEFTFVVIGDLILADSPRNGDDD